MRIGIAGGIVLVLLLAAMVLGYSSMFTVYQTQQALVVRLGQPVRVVTEHGLNFIAFGESLDRFERQLRRMSGHDDGVPDGILSFTRAVSGGYYFCPPLRAGRCDLSVLGA